MKVKRVIIDKAFWEVLVYKSLGVCIIFFCYLLRRDKFCGVRLARKVREEEVYDLVLLCGVDKVMEYV